MSEFFCADRINRYSGIFLFTYFLEVSVSCSCREVWQQCRFNKLWDFRTFSGTFELSPILHIVFWVFLKSESRKWLSQIYTVLVCFLSKVLGFPQQTLPLICNFWVLHIFNWIYMVCCQCRIAAITNHTKPSTFAHISSKFQPNCRALCTQDNPI